MHNKLGDFTSTPRMITISGMAIFIGLVSAFVALALLKLIGFFTNLFFFGHWSAALVSPAGNHLGWWEILVPVAGALIIGVMARYGSERIRGHGIPEAIEAILIGGSRIEPKVAILKPLSSALSIGTGGPFGAEGPIIMTGGAFGSMIAQLFKLTSNERKTLLVAGAAGGMAATFAAPAASCCWRSSCCCLNGSRAAWCRWRWPASRPRRSGVISLASVLYFRCRRIRCSSARRGCFRVCWWASRRADYRRC